MKILIIEDDKDIANFIKKGLTQEGYSIEVVYDGLSGLSLAKTRDFDCAVVDIMLPKLDGLTLIEELRGIKNSMPVIVLSAKSSLDDRVKGLRAGGDDYLTKPFSFTELLARIEALLRRSSSVSQSTIIEVADLTIDTVRRKVTRGGEEIELQPKEFKLLEYLARNRGRVISKTMIIEEVWDFNFDPQTTVVESRISHLRDKIDRKFDEKLIRTVRGVGYSIEDK